MSLVTTADCAYPFAYDRLPAGVDVILGYVGSPTGTPHVWDQAEVDTVRATGRVWAPIWTPPDPALTAQLGRQAGNSMAAALGRYRLTGAEPVFLDIEQHVYAADPDGATQAVAAWTAVMHGAGHRQAWAYVPARAGYGWAANWTGTPPAAVPFGCVGVQYAGNVDGGRYDLSVFTGDVFAPLLATIGKGTDVLDTTDKAWIEATINTAIKGVRTILSAYQWDNLADYPEPYAAKHLHELLAKIDATVTQLAPAAVPVDQLAAALETRLGPKLAADLAANLARRLAQ